MTTWTVPAVVNRVVDADSVSLALSLGFHVYLDATCRLAHCNAPELTTPEGRAARDFVVDLLPIGEMVTFVSHCLDKYGRPLGTVTLPDGRDLGTLLIDAGHAVPYEGGPR